MNKKKTKKAKRVKIYHQIQMVERERIMFQCPVCRIHFDYTDIKRDILRFQCSKCGQEIIAEHLFKPKEQPCWR